MCIWYVMFSCMCVCGCYINMYGMCEVCEECMHIYRYALGVYVCDTCYLCMVCRGLLCGLHLCGIYVCGLCNLFSMYVVHSVCIMGVACVFVSYMVMCVCAMGCETNVWLLLLKTFIALISGSVGERHARDTVHVQRSEDTLQESVLFFHQVGHRDGI